MSNLYVSRDLNVKRRRLLVLGVAAAGGACAPDVTRIGAVTDFAVGSLRGLRAGTFNIVVGRDAMGLFAYTAVCPHRACTVNVNPTGSRCPCHSATFDVNGTRLSGPTTTSLSHYQLLVRNGAVYIRNTAVAPTARTPV